MVDVTDATHNTTLALCTTVVVAIQFATYLLQRLDAARAARKVADKVETAATTLASKVEATATKSVNNQEIVKAELKRNTELTEQVGTATNGRWDQFAKELHDVNVEVGQLHLENQVLWEEMKQQAHVVSKALNIDVENGLTLDDAVKKYNERHKSN